MRVTVVGILVLAMMTAFAASGHTADQPPPAYPGPYPVNLKVGEIFVVVKNVAIVGPVRSPICDDLKIVDVVETPGGLAFKGISPGKTLCSVAAGVEGPRRVFSITVTE